jgi:plasmid stabilization system protein ParE
MIIFSPGALEDVARLRSFLNQANQGAAQRAMALILAVSSDCRSFPIVARRTDDADIRQIVIRFGLSGYVIRYAVLPKTNDILITRIWHGREARS